MAKVEKVVLLKNIVEEFNKLLECPVCLEVLQCPFKMCLNGHSLCVGCTEDLKACPSCQSTFSPEDTVMPIVLKDLIELIPKFCRYRDSGCEEIFDRKQNHEDLCGFRPITCRQKGCNKTVPLCMLRKHYKDIHPVSFVIEKTEDNVVWSDFKPEKGRSHVGPVFFDNNGFWIEIKNDVDKKCLRFQWFLLPCSEIKADYFVRVTFEKGKFSYVYTLKAKELYSDDFWNDEESSHPERNSIASNELDMVFKMEIPQSSLEHFINDKGVLEWKYEFFNISKPAL